MKTLPTALRGTLERRTAIEPVVFIGVEWTPGNEILYSSHEVEGMRHNLLSVSGLETSTQLDGAGASQSVSIVLSDTSGEIKHILSSVDPHKVQARVYLTFADIPESERVILLDGQINSPMVWAEGDRTFSFTILTRIESSEVGFSMQDGFFPEGDQQQRSAVWPTRFGTTCAYKALRLTSPIKGFTGEGQGVLDPTIDLRICQATKINCPNIQVAVSKSVISYTHTGGEFIDYRLYSVGEPLPTKEGRSWIAIYSLDGPSGYWPVENGRRNIPPNYSTEVPPGVTPLPNPSAGLYVSQPDPACVREQFNVVCQLLRDKANQEKYIKKTFQVRGGEAFPQNQPIRIRIKDVVFVGSMNGSTFSVTTAIHPETSRIAGITCQNIGPASVGVRRALNAPDTLDDCATPSSNFKEFVVGGATEGWLAFGELPQSKFIWLPPGSEVLLDDSSAQIHMVSTIPGIVTQVLAYRTFGDTRILTIVPPKYYTVVIENFDAFQVTEVRMNRTLSLIERENWGDDIYVSFISIVGPNPVDCIQWIIDNYTDLTADTASFAAVRSYLQKYPANFVLESKVDAVSLMTQIARQARCAITLVGNKVSLIYLARDPVSVRTIGRSDIEVGTFQVTLSETEQIKTKHIARFRDSGTPIVDSDPNEKTVEVVNENIEKYGISTREENYFTITDEQQALKTATFWSIREGNTWKRVEFLAALKHIDLDIFDAFTLDIPQFPNVKCVVQTSVLDGDQVRIVAWTPVLAGTEEEYLWAWPATRPGAVRYPRPGIDLTSPGPQVVVPDDHPLAGYLGAPRTLTTYGDPFPSDLDDVFPATVCRDPADSALIDDIQPQFDRFAFAPLDTSAQRYSDAAEEREAEDLSGSFEDDKEDGGCSGDFAPGNFSCLYEVKLFYITPTLVATQAGPSSTCKSSGPCSAAAGFGRACAGPFDEVCHTFGSLTIAEQFAAGRRAHGQFIFDNCRHLVGKRDLFSAASVFGPIVAASSADKAGCAPGGPSAVYGEEPPAEVFKPVENP